MRAELQPLFRATHLDRLVCIISACRAMLGIMPGNFYTRGPPDQSPRSPVRYSRGVIA